MFVCMCLGITAKHCDQRVEIWHVLYKNLDEHNYTYVGMVIGYGFAIDTPTEVILAEKVNQRQIRQIVGIWSTSTTESIINHMWALVGHSHTY